MRSPRPSALAIFTLVFSLVGFSEDAAAQTTNAALQGIVSDSSGDVLPGVTVKLESPSTGLSRGRVTNAAGVYVFNFLPAGAYVVSAIQVDLAMQKRFAINGRRNFEFRWEAFNAFNRMNLANPATNISTPATFERITGPLNSGYGTGTARQMQMMLRMNF